MVKDNPRETWRPKSNATRPSCSAEQRKRYPILCDVLEGAADDKGIETQPAYGITLFVGSDGVRFSFGSRQSGEAWFGQVGKSADVLEALEGALCRGEYEAKFVRRDERYA